MVHPSNKPRSTVPTLTGVPPVGPPPYGQQPWNPPHAKAMPPAAIAPQPLAGTQPATTIDFRHFASLLRRNWLSILAIAAALTLPILAWTLAATMRFSATASLYLGDQDSSRSTTDFDISVRGHDDIASEIQIITSQSLLRAAVMSSGLNTHVRVPEWQPPRYWEWRRSGRDPELLRASRGELRARDTYLDSELGEPEVFNVEFLTAERYSVTRNGQLLGEGVLGQPEHLGLLHLTLLPDATPPAVGRRYELTVSPVYEEVELAREDLQVWALKPVVGNEVRVVSLEFTHRSPASAAAFLSELMNVYLRERLAWKTEEASAAESFVTTQLNATRQKLQELQEHLADYRKDNPSVVLAGEAQMLVAQVGSYEGQRVAARLELAALNSLNRALKKPDPPIESFMMGEAKDAVLMSMAQELATAKRKLEDIGTRFGPHAPEIKEAHLQVNAQLASIREYVAGRLQRAKSNLGTLSGVIGQYQEKMKSVPGAEVGLAQLTRESDVYNSLYSSLLKRQQETAIQKASTVSKNRVLDPAYASYLEKEPSLGPRLATLPLGLLVGILFAFFRGLSDVTFRSESDLRRTVGPLSVYSRIPGYARSRWRRPAGELPFNAMDGGKNFDYVEAFRLLRTNLYHSGSGNVILVTSPSAGDGKTTCAISLAAMLAADNKSVLVVDADLRKSRPGSQDDEAATRSLKAVLVGASEWRDVVRPVATSTAHFHAIEAGGLAPAELLSTDGMRRFIEEASAACDYVILDAPPYPVVSDALVLASVADCILSVVRLGHTPRRDTLEHTRRLQMSGAAYGLVLVGSDEDQPQPAYAQGAGGKQSLSIAAFPSEVSRHG